MNRLKMAWGMVPLAGRVAIEGAASAAAGGAFTAFVIWLANPTGVKDLWPAIVAGASGALRLYVASSSWPAFKFQKALEKGEAFDRRQS